MVHSPMMRCMFYLVWAADFVLGNDEMNMLMMHKDTAQQEWWTHSQFDLPLWIYKQMDDSVFDFLENLPEQFVVHLDGCAPFRVVHGSPWDNNKLSFPGLELEVLDRVPAMIPEKVIIFAHTHLPAIIRKNGKLAVNQGSVVNNLNGDTRTSDATLEWDGFCWQSKLHFVPYNLGEVVEDFRSSGFLDATCPLGRAFLESILMGDKTGWDFILYVFNLAKEARYGDLPAFPDDIWFEAQAAFPWYFSIEEMT